MYIFYLLNYIEIYCNEIIVLSYYFSFILTNEINSNMFECFFGYVFNTLALGLRRIFYFEILCMHILLKKIRHD